jgi:hypothetical protein
MLKGCKIGENVEQMNEVINSVYKAPSRRYDYIGKWFICEELPVKITAINKGILTIEAHGESSECKFADLEILPYKTKTDINKLRYEVNKEQRLWDKCKEPFNETKKIEWLRNEYRNWLTLKSWGYLDQYKEFYHYYKNFVKLVEDRNVIYEKYQIANYGSIE